MALLDAPILIIDNNSSTEVTYSLLLLLLFLFLCYDCNLFIELITNNFKKSKITESTITTIRKKSTTTITTIITSVTPAI